jgi:hypothetical protein
MYAAAAAVALLGCGGSAAPSLPAWVFSAYAGENGYPGAHWARVGYDHVKPVTFNYFEAAFRLPLVIVSPYAKRGYISHRVHYTGSILHFIEHTYGLRRLGKSDARSDRFEDGIDFSQKPLQYIPIKPPGSLQSLFEDDLPSYGDQPLNAQRRD